MEKKWETASREMLRAKAIKQASACLSRHWEPLRGSVGSSAGEVLEIIDSELISGVLIAA